MAYYVWQVMLFLIVLYSVSYFLVFNKKISLATHKRIWNVMLLLCFLGVGVLGMLLALGIYPGNGLFLHVQFGVAFFTIAFFHIVWHMYYFRQYLKK